MDVIADACLLLEHDLALRVPREYKNHCNEEKEAGDPSAGEAPDEDPW